MKEKEYLNLLTYGKPEGTITLRLHPKDVIDVNPEIISNMKAKLKMNITPKVYNISDRTIDELALMREKSKLKRIFSNECQLKKLFSSIKNIKIIQEELSLEKIDRKLLFEYSYIKSDRINMDEIDFYRAFLFNAEWISKKERIRRYNNSVKIKDVFIQLLEDYKSTHSDILKITKEMIQMNSVLAKLFKERKLIRMFDEFLVEFYNKQP